MDFLQKLRTIRNARWLRRCARGGAIVFLGLMCGMWVRSYYVYDYVIISKLGTKLIGTSIHEPLDTLYFRNEGGTFDTGCRLFSTPVTSGRFTYDTYEPDRMSHGDALTQVFGFDFTLNRHEQTIQMPYWLAIACWLGITWLIVRFTRCVPLPNTCLSCGYNLRGNPTAACPECGAESAITTVEAEVQVEVQVDVQARSKPAPNAGPTEATN